MSWRSKSPENGKGPKSSPAARRLIRAALKRLSQREAAYVLRLKSAAQLNRMLHGKIHDTPEMQAALIRAKKRADRAYYLVRADREPLDVETLKKLLHEIDERVALVTELIKAAPLKTEDDHADQKIPRAP